MTSKLPEHLTLLKHKNKLTAMWSRTVIRNLFNLLKIKVTSECPSGAVICDISCPLWYPRLQATSNKISCKAKIIVNNLLLYFGLLMSLYLPFERGHSHIFKLVLKMCDIHVHVPCILETPSKCCSCHMFPWSGQSLTLKKTNKNNM